MVESSKGVTTITIYQPDNSNKIGTTTTKRYKQEELHADTNLAAMGLVVIGGGAL
ncbi:enoyl-CoA hydratase/isomerase family protein [Sesbania bispinosa]|nr:enoyl-CoA hydratase/isomerase family protein [Sesbania bispinosa]